MTHIHRPRRNDLFALLVVSRKLGAEDFLNESSALLWVHRGRAAGEGRQVESAAHRATGTRAACNTDVRLGLLAQGTLGALTILDDLSDELE